MTMVKVYVITLAESWFNFVPLIENEPKVSRGEFEGVRGGVASFGEEENSTARSKISGRNN